jgi:hypothetical protein
MGSYHYLVRGCVEANLPSLDVLHRPMPDRSSGSATMQPDRPAFGKNVDKLWEERVASPVDLLYRLIWHALVEWPCTETFGDQLPEIWTSLLAATYGSPVYLEGCIIEDGPVISAKQIYEGSRDLLRHTKAKLGTSSRSLRASHGFTRAMQIHAQPHNPYMWRRHGPYLQLLGLSRSTRCRCERQHDT